MHIPSKMDYEEILATPAMVRFAIGTDGDGRTPTILLRCTTLQAKYALQASSYKVVLLPVSNEWLAYGLEIEDDPENPMLLWSIVERDSEIEALKCLSRSPRCSIAIYAETGANIAFVQAECSFGSFSINELIAHIQLHPDDDRSGPEEVVGAFKAIRAREDGTLTSLIEGQLSPKAEWKLIGSMFITGSLSRTLIDLKDADEGRQQELLVEALADGVSPREACRSPQVEISKEKTRELVDVIATSEHTYFLFESKGLKVLADEKLPARNRLAKNTLKHLKKAVGQLRGAIRHIKAEKLVFNPKGEQIDLPKSPGHAIVVVPDTSLVRDSDDPGAELLTQFYQDTKHMLHIVDPTELVRIIQAANRAVEEGGFAKPVDAFHEWFARRFESAVKHDVAAIEIVHRFPSDDTRMGQGYVPIDYPPH